MSTDTANQKLATHLLGEPVHTWIAHNRTDGHSLRAIANKLAYLTDGQVDVTPEAIRQWALEQATT